MINLYHSFIAIIMLHQGSATITIYQEWLIRININHANLLSRTKWVTLYETPSISNAIPQPPPFPVILFPD